MTADRRLGLAWTMGLLDGYEDGAAFGCGRTWPDDQGMNEAYDTGVNLGQALAAEEGR